MGESANLAIGRIIRSRLDAIGIYAIGRFMRSGVDAIGRIIRSGDRQICCRETPRRRVLNTLSSQNNLAGRICRETAPRRVLNALSLRAFKFA